MREPFNQTNNNNTTENKVPLSPNSRRSKRKMDQRRLGIRGLFKNPPQPHMCVQDTLLGSSEPCFVNVLSWDKISMPAHPKDPIPLYGGIRIFNNSMNSLTFTNTYDGCKPGKQPVIFAVLANTEILKFSGKAAKDPNERDALIYLILDFVEVMNEGVRFSHRFSVVPHRDVVGELKDIWFVIQSKREQERMELTYHGECDRAAGDRHKPSSHRQRESPLPPAPWLGSDQEKEKITRSRSYPEGNESRSKDSVWLYSSCAADNSEDERGGAAGKLPTETAGCSQSRKIVCVDSPPTSQGDEEEVVLFQHDYIKKTPLQRPTVSLYDYFPSSLKASGKDSKVSSVSEDIRSKVSTTTGVLPSYREVQYKGNFCETNASDASNSERQASENKENNYLPSFTDISRGMTLRCIYDKEETKLASIIDGTPGATPGASQASFDSFDNEAEEELFDQVRRVVATEILPSLDSLETESEGASLVAERDLACVGIDPEMFISTAEIFPHCPEAKNVKQGEFAGDDMIVNCNAEKVTNSQEVIDVQLSKFAEVLDTLDERLKTNACDTSVVQATASFCVVGTVQIANLEQLTRPLEATVRPELGSDPQSPVVVLKNKDHRDLFDKIDVVNISQVDENCLGKTQILPSTHLSESNVHGCLLNRVNRYVPDASSRPIVAPTSVSQVMDYFGKPDDIDSNENVKPFGNGNMTEALKPVTLVGPRPLIDLRDRINTSLSLIDEINRVEMRGAPNKTELDPENNVTNMNYDIPCIATLGINNTIKSNNHADRKPAGGPNAVEHK